MKNIICRSIAILAFSSFSFCASAQVKKTNSKTVKTTSAEKPADMITRFQGKWVSEDDKKVYIVFKGYQQIDMYGKDILDTSAINFYNQCPEKFSPEDPKAKAGSHLVIGSKEGDFLCYEVEYLTPTQLHLIYTGRGNTLRYRKVQLKK